MTFLLFVLGLALLIGGAEILVRGASHLAARIGIPPLIIGLTVVAFGTSAPELAVSIESSIRGEPNIAVGNVIGSNTFNVLFILGLSAVIAPLVVSKQLIQIDVPIMIVASLVVLYFGWNQQISWTEGAILFGSALVYTLLLIIIGMRAAKSEEADAQRAEMKKDFNWTRNGFLVIGGFVGLAFGSRWLVQSAVEFAQMFGLSETIIGLTIIAVGTSLPEVVTSIMASVKGERDIAVGNVVGSNLFNLLGVLGVAALFSPGGINIPSSVAWFDFPVMTAVAVVCLPIFFTGGEISRWEGLVLFGYYIAYTSYLILDAQNYDALPYLSNTMFFFVVPLTIMTLCVTTWNAIKQRRSKRRSTAAQKG